METAELVEGHGGVEINIRKVPATVVAAILANQLVRVAEVVLDWLSSIIEACKIVYV